MLLLLLLLLLLLRLLFMPLVRALVCVGGWLEAGRCEDDGGGGGGGGCLVYMHHSCCTRSADSLLLHYSWPLGLLDFLVRRTH